MGKNQVGFLHEKTGQKTCKISLSLGKQKTLEKKSFVRPSLFSFRFVVWGDGSGVGSSYFVDRVSGSRGRGRGSAAPAFAFGRTNTGGSARSGTLL